MALSPELLDKLACPKCHGEVTLLPDGSALTCAPCGLAYAIDDDIPNFIVAEARKLSPS